MTLVTTVLEGRARRDTLPPMAALHVVGIVIGWITVVLLMDADSTHWVQRGLGLATWAVLAAMLVRESPLVRMQTAVVVGYASIIEYTFSPLLEVYTYRFDNVPLYVPPGHGLVYLAALAIGRLAFVQAHSRSCAGAVITVGGAYAVYGVTLAGRSDVLGACWFLCLVGFLWWGPSRGLYVGAFVVVTWLELLGTAVGTWRWQPVDPTGLITIGNPPSGAAGGYGWFDLAALMLAPGLLNRWQRLTSTSRQRVS